MNPPIFLSAVYDGTSVLVSWRAGNNPGITINQYIATVTASNGQSWPQTVQGFITTVSIPTGALAATGVTYTVQVCATATGQTNACTDQYLVLTVQPVLTAANYGSTAVTLQWTPMPQSAQVTSYTASLFPTSGGVSQVVTVDATQSAATIPLAQPLTGGYSVQITGSNAYGVGAATAVAPINTTLPTINAATYTGSSIILSWNAPQQPAVAIDGYLLSATASDGGAPFTAPASAAITSAAIPIPWPLDPSRQYQVSVTATTATAASSTSAPTAINAVQPRLTSVAWDGTDITATWQPVGYPSPPVTGYQMIATSPSGGSPIVASVSGSWASSGTISSPGFVATFDYQLRISAQSAGSVATYSDPVEIFSSLPAITGVTYDGASVAITWTAAQQGPEADAYRVTVASSSGSNSATVDGSARDALLLLDTPLDTAGTWSVVVVATAGIASATSAAVPLVVAQPVLSSATYTGTRLAALWAIAQPPAQFFLRLISTNGSGSYSSSAIQPPVTNGTIDFTTPLDPAGIYAVVVEAQFANGVKTLSAAHGLIAALPLVVSAAYDGTNVAAQWIPIAAAQPQPGGYQLKVYSNQGGSTNITTIRNAAASSGIVAGPANTSLASVAQVCAFAGPVQSCSPQLALVQSSATISSVTYDGANVTAEWTAVTGATAYTVSIEQGGAAIASATVSGTTAAISARLDAAQTYDISVRAIVTSAASNVAAAAAGPAASNAVISAAPKITNVVTSATGVTLTLDVTATSAAAGVSGYQATLWQGETPVATGSAGTASATSIVINHALAPQYAYRATVQAVGSDAAKFAGPPTALAAVIAEQPAITITSVSGTTATIAWTPAADAAVTGYSIVVTQDDTAGDPIYTTATQHNVTIDPTKSVTVAVTAIGSNATGLTGASATLITETLTPTTATYDGVLLTMSWPSAATAGATYIAEVLSGGGVVARVAQSATTASIPVSLYGTATVRVIVVAGSASGAAGGTLAVIATVPPIISTSATTTDVTATIDTSSTTGQPGVSAWQAALFQNGKLVAGPVAATGSGQQVTVAIPTSGLSGSGFTMRARAVGADSTRQFGPWGDPATAILFPAAIGEVEYDGTNLLITWSAITDPAVAAYRVSIGSTEVTVSGSAATIRVALVANASAVVNVTPAGANATGPTSSNTFLRPAQVSLLTAGYNGTNVSATWTALGDEIDAYRMELYVDSALAATALIIGAGSTGGAIPATLAPGAVATIAVTAMNGAIAGPLSAALPLLANRPQLTDVFYDGTNVSASWTAVAGASAYELAVYQGTTQVTSQSFTTTSGAMPATLSGTGYSVYVRATATNTSGAWSAAVDPQSGPATFFLSSNAADVPYLYRSAYRPPLAAALTSAAVTLYFPDLFTGNPPSTPPQGAFTLGTVANGGNIKYSIAVASSVWTFDATTNIRATLRQQFLAFVQWLEPALKPGAAPFIIRALSLGMPLTFEESLLYRYGFSAANGYVDLVAGMKLRLDTEAYQLIPNSSPASVNGFVSGGSTTYDITAATISGGSQPAINTAFDAFLSLLSSTTVPASQGGGGGVIDLYQAGMVKPYYRLFYPVNFPAAGVQGYSDPSRNIALVGASTIAALESATATYLQQKNWNGVPSASVSVSYFRGRMVALPRITVVVDGVAQDVAIGTTLRQLIGSWANLPFSESLQVTSVSVERPVGGVLDSVAQAATSLGVAQNNPIRFATQNVITFAGGEDWFDLPLFGADRITLGAT